MRKISKFTLLIFTLMAVSFIPSCIDNPTDPQGDTPTVDPKPVEPTCEHKCPYCKKCKDEDSTLSCCVEKCSCEPLEITHTSSVICSGKLYETPVHVYSTNKEGPNIFIMGGTHGDEVAGWTEALALVDLLEDSNNYLLEGSAFYGLSGNLMIIPQASIIADKVQQRFPGKNSSNAKSTVSYTYNSVTLNYSDLNRAWPEHTSSYSVASSSENIRNGIDKAISDFEDAYGPCTALIDLHEARTSWTTGEATGESNTLGDTLIYNNKGAVMSKIMKRYNKFYRPDGETQFSSNPSTQKGSFNYHYTSVKPDTVVFTVETNRAYDTIDVSVRTRQQHNILQAAFDILLDRI